MSTIYSCKFAFTVPVKSTSRRFKVAKSFRHLSAIKNSISSLESIRNLYPLHHCYTLSAVSFRFFAKSILVPETREDRRLFPDH